MTDWRHRAACRDEDPELFFPIGNTGPALLQIEDAKAVCRRCDVADQCLQWALETSQDAGVWGAMSEDERRALKRRTQRANRSGTTPGTHGGARRCASPETHNRAIARYSELRPAYPSDTATFRAVADELDLNITTVAGWVKTAQAANAETARS